MIGYEKASNTDLKETESTDEPNEESPINSAVTSYTDEPITEISLDDPSTKISFCEVFSRVSKIALPMTFSYTFSIEVFIISILASHLDDNENHMAAITLILTTMNTMAVISIAPLTGMAIIVSNDVGDLWGAMVEGASEEILQEKRLRIANVNKSGILISFIIAVPAVAGLFYSKRMLVYVFEQSEDIAEIAQNFLRIYSPALPALLFRMCFEQIMFSFKRAMPAMTIGLVDLALGTLVSVWLASGGLGVSPMGLTGIAIGYALEGCLTSAGFGLYIAQHPDFRQFKFFDFCGSTWQMIHSRVHDILKIGGYISLTMINEALMPFAMGLLSGFIGIREQAALATSMQFIFLMFIPLLAFGQTCSQETSREVGRGHYEDAGRVARYGLLTTLLYMAPPCLLMASDPDILINLFGGNNERLRSLEEYIIPIVAIGTLFEAMRFNMLQVLRSLFDLSRSAAISVSGLWLGLILGGILGFETDLGIYGIAGGYSVGIMFAGLGLSISWCKRTKATEIERAKEEDARRRLEASAVPSFISMLFLPCRCGRRVEAEILPRVVEPAQEQSYFSGCIDTLFGWMGSCCRRRTPPVVVDHRPLLLSATP